MDEMPIAEARADLSAATWRVKEHHSALVLTRRGKPQAALVPFELAYAVEKAGGPDKAIKILEQALQA